MSIKQDFAELRYKNKIVKFDILYDNETEDIIPLFQLHDLIAINHKNKNKKATLKVKVNPQSNQEEIYLSSFIEDSVLKEEILNKNKQNEKQRNSR